TPSRLTVGIAALATGCSPDTDGATVKLAPGCGTPARPVPTRPGPPTPTRSTVVIRPRPAPVDAARQILPGGQRAHAGHPTAVGLARHLLASPNRLAANRFELLPGRARSCVSPPPSRASAAFCGLPATSSCRLSGRCA